MKKRKLTIFCLLTVTFIMTACSGKKENSRTLTDKDDPKEVIEIATNVYNQGKKRSSETIYESFYTNGETEKETGTYVFDEETGTSYTSSEYENGDMFEKFISKEEDSVYVYIKDTTRGEGWIRYKEETDANNETSYEYTQNPLEFLFREEEGYSDVQYSNEGKEKVDGKDAIKIKVTALANAQETGEDYGVELITRESFLAENAWSEESVKAVEGFSEMLDEYIRLYNEMTSYAMIETASEEESLIWIDVYTQELLKIETTAYTNQGKTAKVQEEFMKLEMKFWDRSWEVSSIQMDLDQGLSMDKAKANADSQRAEMEALYQDADYGEMAENVQEKFVIVQNYKIGEGGLKMPELPSEYEEISQEDYYNGY